MELTTLFSPHKINNCVIPNRLVVPAMATRFNVNGDGTCHERYAAYIERRAKGGWGLIITENFPVTEHAMNQVNMGGLFNDDQIPGYKAMTERVHKYDSKIFAQLYHAGRQSHKFPAGIQPLAPSSIPCAWCREMPAEITKEQIQIVVNAFGDAAARARKAGFDGVEIHAAHGYLLHEFLSTNTNKRVDEYGGCLTNRTRILKEVIDNVRSKVGLGYPVTIRLSAFEHVPGGREMFESRSLFKLAEDYGYDALHVSSGIYGNDGIVSSMFKSSGWITDCARQAKGIVKIPVITVNRINEPLQAEELLEAGMADFVAIGRGSLADPDLPLKAKDGKFDEIRYCLTCSIPPGCVNYNPDGSTNIACASNPETGREYMADYSPAKNPKKVFIAGGGPGGMQAAITSAIKGHDVVLFEKSFELGGQFRVAAFPPYKGHVAAFTAWQSGEMKRQGAKVRMNTALTAEIVAAEKPDVVIVATGAHLICPDVPGIDSPKVLMADDVLRGRVETGDNVLVVGCGETGRETAALLSVEQKEVTVIKRSPISQRELNDDGFLQLLEERHVPIRIGVTLAGVCEQGALLNTGDGVELYPCDNLVIAYNTVSENALYHQLKDTVPELFLIGDAVKPRRVRDAVSEGFLTALSL